MTAGVYISPMTCSLHNTYKLGQLIELIIEFKSTILITSKRHTFDPKSRQKILESQWS